MKQIILLFVLVSYSAFASHPKCNDSFSVIPCEFSDEMASSSVIDMMLANKAGMSLLHTSGENGLILDTLSESNRFKVTILSFEETGENFKSVTQYEVLLNDCRGSDHCLGTYLWKVLETAEGDGYTSDYSFENSLTKLH